VSSTKPDRERTRLRQLRLVRKVAECYQSLQYAMPLTASNPDPSPGARSLRWTPNTTHFIIDVEHAVRDATANQLDALELRAAWAQIIDDPSTIRESELKLIRLLAPILERRELEPYKYFRRIRRGRAA
jgi:hypothetical protein